mgnify:CR=1 FL=1|tara:strand:+ start:752 stop:1762 length:1011 start_codon:yes stop_codon:yes gene_type:complete
MEFNKLLTDVRNPQSNSFKIVIGVIVLIVILLIWRFKVKKAEWDKINPVFFKKGMDAKKYQKIKPKKFYDSPTGTEFTWFFWMYVDNMVYKYGKWKDVLIKGKPGSHGDQGPGVYIHPKINKLRIEMSTNRKLDRFDLDDFPIRKWFSVAIVVKETEIEIYMDGKLKTTTTLSGRAKTNTGVLHLCRAGGFGGNMSSVSYYPAAKSHRFMEVKHGKGPFDERWWQKIWNYFRGKAMALKGSVKIDIDVDLDMGKYKKNTNARCPGQMIKDVGKVSLSKAQELCDKDPKCHCIVRMDKKFGRVPKGNYRLSRKDHGKAKIIKGAGTRYSGYFTAFTK